MAHDGIEFTSAPDPEHELKAKLINYLALDIDIALVYKSIRLDDEVSDSINKYRGMRVLKQDPWECLVSFICSANSNLTRIKRNIEDIATLCGDKIESDRTTRNSFPTPDRLASAGPESLRGLRLGYRAEYLHKAALMVADGRLNPWKLSHVSYDQALEELLRVPGVGDKVANCVMLFSMDKPDAFPVDTWIHRILEETYHSEIKAFHRRLIRQSKHSRGRRKHGEFVTRNRLRAWGQEKFGPYAGWANHYLFHARRNRS